MTKYALLFLLILAEHSIYAYDKPNSIAYDAVSKSYYISNNHGKTITRLDSNFDKTDVIKGLTSPKDLMFATFGPYRGLLILDSNQIKVYDADSFNFITSFTITGAIDLEDAELDKNQPNIFYITDPHSNTIFKVVVGGAPFYNPSFSILSNAVRKPKALFFDGKNRLLVTTDTVQTPVYSIDLSTGSPTLVQNTTIDYINSLEEDQQGNFYATSWGDSYLYRMDKNFKNATGLASYSKPTGLYFNSADDLIAMACSNCNKVEFHKLHMVYINNADTAGCPGESFYININQQYKGKGTYNSGNTFYAELSDANGNFKAPLIIGSEKNLNEPASLKLVLPKDRRFAGSNYKIRVKSTNPLFYSINEIEVVVPYIPTVSISASDSILFCSPSKIKFGKPKDIDSGFVNYLWYENRSMVSNNLSWYEKTYTKRTKIQLIKSPLSGSCLVKDSVTVIPSSSITIPFKDTLRACENSWISVGGDSIYDTKIEWSSKNYPAIRNVFNPLYQLHNNDTFLVKVISNSGSCVSQKNIYAFTTVRPDYEIEKVLYFACSSNSIALEPKFNKGAKDRLEFRWIPSNHLNSATSEKVIFKSNAKGPHTYKFIAIDSVYNCYDSLQITVVNSIQPAKPMLAENKDGAVIRNYDAKLKYIWKKDGKIILQSTQDSQLVVQIKVGSYRVIVSSSDSLECTDSSDKLDIIELIGLHLLQKKSLIVYPNPAKDKLMIKGLDDFKGLQFFDLTGREVSEKISYQNGEINITHLLSGIYSIHINFEGQYLQTIFIKE